MTDPLIQAANAAWCQYEAACTPDYPNAAETINEAIAAVESIVGRARPGSPAWFTTRIQLGHILVGSVGLTAAVPETERIAGRLERATDIAKEILSATDQTPWGVDQRQWATGLACSAAHGMFQLLGRVEGLRSAIAYADDLPINQVTRFDTAFSALTLYLTHFEVMGRAEDLVRGIALGEWLLANAGSEAGTHKSVEGRIRSVQQTFSMFLTFRVLESCPASQGPGAKASGAADCERAVQLARAASAGPHEVAFNEGLAAQALGMALRAQAILNNDPRSLSEAISCFLRAIQCAGIESPAGALYANNAATAMGDFAQAAPTHQIVAGRSVLNDAIDLLRSVLERHEIGARDDGRQLLEIKFNFTRLTLLRIAQGGLSGDLAYARAAITDCTTWLISGHRRRAGALAVRAELGLQEFVADSDRQHLVAALEDALEAEALVDSGAPVAEFNQTVVHSVLATWREHGGSEEGPLEGRLRATRKLVDALPEHAASLANRRALAALRTGDSSRAADYVEIAISASIRALVVADDLDLAYRLAETLGVVSALPGTAIGIANQAPERAVMLLEGAQANSICRLQMSLGTFGNAPAREHPAVQRYLVARAKLRGLIKFRREGRMSATAEALRIADQELDAAIRDVHSVPGMSQFLVQIVSFAQLRELGAPCVFIVAGPRGGMALVVGTDGSPNPVALPLLSEERVAAQVGRHLAALTRFESGGDEELGVFQQALGGATSWLEETAINPIRAHLDERPWTFIPCGLLCNLPWSAATAARPITYAPSVQVCARARHGVAARRYLLVYGPDERTGELPGADGLHEWIERLVGEKVTLLRGPSATADAVVHAATLHQSLLFYAHGVIRQEAPLSSGILLSGDTCLDLRTIIANAEAFTGRTIILASCSQGQPDPRVPNQMLGPATAFLAAGARTVIAPSWPVEVASARIVATALVEALRAGLSPEEALVAAQARVRNAGSVGAKPIAVANLRRGSPPARAPSADADRSFTHPYFSGAFAVYGPAYRRSTE